MVLWCLAVQISTLRLKMHLLIRKIHQFHPRHQEESADRAKIADLNISQVNLVSLQSYQLVQSYTGCISINMVSGRFKSFMEPPLIRTYNNISQLKYIYPKFNACKSTSGWVISWVSLKIRSNAFLMVRLSFGSPTQLKNVGGE